MMILSYPVLDQNQSGYETSFKEIIFENLQPNYKLGTGLERKPSQFASRIYPTHLV